MNLVKGVLLTVEVICILWTSLIVLYGYWSLALGPFRAVDSTRLQEDFNTLGQLTKDHIAFVDEQILESFRTLLGNMEAVKNETEDNIDRLFVLNETLGARSTSIISFYPRGSPSRFLRRDAKVN